MKSIALVMVMLSGLISTPILARDYTSDWTLFPESAGVMALSAEVHVPKSVQSSQNAEVSLILGTPIGCYRTEVAVEYRDTQTHVLRPKVVANGYPCVQVSQPDIRTVDLGRLSAGEHKIFVEDVAKPVLPVTFWVSDGDALATH